MRLRLLHAVASLAFVSRVPLAQTGSETGALPYHLAFDRAELSSGGWFDVSSDGKWAAYVIQRSLPDTTEAQAKEIALRTGTPNVVMGSKVHITNLDSRRTIEACPGNANSWAPSWSKDAETLAFYSDAGGVPQLWAYSVKDGKCRRISEAVLKPLFWVYIGNEPKWSPDGRTVFVPLRPAAENPGPRAQAGTTATDKPHVRVYRSTSEGSDSLPRESTVAGATDLSRSQVIEIGAIDVITGAVRTLASAQTEPRPKLLRASPTGRWVSYMSVPKQPDARSHRTTVQLAVVPAAGGKVWAFLIE
jgi:hypothetical protein